MLNFNGLKIRSKLRILSLISIASLTVLGIVSNYFFNTSKVVGIMINAERVHNNTFQVGVEEYYKYRVTGDKQLLDSAIFHMEKANQMAYNFGIIDETVLLSKEESAKILLNIYQEAYNNDLSNAYLMVSRIKLFVLLNKEKLSEAQQIAMKGYHLGEKVKKGILLNQKDSTYITEIELAKDLGEMRNFYKSFAEVISSLNSFANQLLIVGILVVVILLVLAVMLISTLIAKSIVEPVQEMVDKFKVIAKGNLNTSISIAYDNEIGQLASSFSEIQSGLRDVIEYTKKVASGDYGSRITPRSTDDELSIALNQMVANLKESYDQTELNSWFKSGFNLINEKLQGDQLIDDISNHSLSFMMEFLHSQLGSIHLYNAEYQFLKLVSASGFDPKKLKERIKLKEGILGQVAFDKQILILDQMPDQTYITYSSSGEYVPKQIVVVPLLFNEILIGVLELSSIQPYTGIEIEFMQQVAQIIAVNLNSAENSLRTNLLLQKTQEQASELQVQQEELRVANEELVEHTKVLTENEKRLQVQQEELRVANEELEERTRQLEIQKEDITTKNSELTEAQGNLEHKAKELQQASQYKSEFLANMSHELRTPLNSLLILSNLLANNKKGNLTDDQIQSAKIIHKSGSDLLHLINEVLDLSKIEAGKMSLEIDAIRTVDLQDDILMNFNALAEDRNLGFEVRMSDEFPEKIRTDRYRLMQILKNLLSNAFKFTNSGRISVDFMTTAPEIELRNRSLNSSNTCCIRVSDTGVGIPAEKLEAIFEAFQQADGSISRKFGGTGLGLSISRELIKMLGGEIQLESMVNSGSSFYIYLPVDFNLKDEVNSSKAKTSVVSNPNNPINISNEIESRELEIAQFIDDDRNETSNTQMILIVHPSKQKAEILIQQTRAKNYRTIVASSIADGIILAEKYHPKAILLASELADANDQNYLKLKNHRIIGKLPVHLITPIEYNESEVHGELKTLENLELANAFRSLEGQFVAGNRNILVVEDDVVTRKIISDLLSPLEVNIETVNMANDAYKKLENEKFDCVILDLGLPDYSGKELLEKLRLNHIAIPKVIVYTGKDISKEDIKNLNNYTNTIILKGLKSDERLMDEVTLFLHQVSKTIPEVKTKIILVDDYNLLKGKKILVVDDEIRNVFALAKILEEKDIEVIEAENGQVAIDLLKGNTQIDLVLMDVMMPVMDGYEAMRIIRKTEEIKNIPIICLTAKAMKEDHENAIKNGANDYLSKPLNEEKLFAMLKIWLYKK